MRRLKQTFSDTDRLQVGSVGPTSSASPSSRCHMEWCRMKNAGEVRPGCVEGAAKGGPTSSRTALV